MWFIKKATRRDASQLIWNEWLAVQLGSKKIKVGWMGLKNGKISCCSCPEPSLFLIVSSVQTKSTLLKWLTWPSDDWMTTNPTKKSWKDEAVEVETFFRLTWNRRSSILMKTASRLFETIGEQWFEGQGFESWGPYYKGQSGCTVAVSHWLVSCVKKIQYDASFRFVT